MLKKVLGIGVGIIALVSVVLNLVLWQKTRNPQNIYRVQRVIDGDTYTLTTGETYRLINIEAPELGFCAGDLAKQKLTDLIEGKNIRYEIVAHDVFNRPLTLTYVDGTLINLVMLKEGLARYEGSPSPKRDEFKKSADEAVNNKRGIFGLCVSDTPDKPDCKIKGNIDRHDPKLKIYYFPGCSNYQQTLVEKDLGESWFCTEKDAQTAGYKKSQNCYKKKYSP